MCDIIVVILDLRVRSASLYLNYHLELIGGQRTYIYIYIDARTGICMLHAWLVMEEGWFVADHIPTTRTYYMGWLGPMQMHERVVCVIVLYELARAMQHAARCTIMVTVTVAVLRAPSITFLALCSCSILARQNKMSY